MTKVSIKIGGHAGEGIISAGQILSKTFLRGGYNVFGATDYPSLIRGGDNTFYVRAEDEEVNTHIKTYDILIGLTKETLENHKNEVSYDGVIVCDENSGFEFNNDKNIVVLKTPLIKIAKNNGTVLLKNTVALAISLGLINYDLKILEKVLKSIFLKKGNKVLSDNINAARDGFDWVKKNFDCESFKIKLPILNTEKKKILLTGNDAISIASIKAGCKFISAYPMTPSTSIIEYLASVEKDYDIIVKQTEDEIAAINMAIGSSITGTRSMTATSGGGFCLMVEGLGLCGIIETPLVIIEVQRGGPSTGLPTHTEQGDLRFVTHAGHGEFPRVVLSPGSVEECFSFTYLAFNLSEKYQLPVIILSDKYLSMSYKSTNPFSTKNLKIDRGEVLKKVGKDYKRFKNTKTGVSPRVLPGTKNGVHRVTGNEHDEYGRISEKPDDRVMQMDKRYRKLDSCFKELPKPELIGENFSQITMVCYGSMRGVCVDAIKFLKNEGINANILHIKTIHPLHEKEITFHLKNSKKIISIENNKTAQLSKLITEFTGIKIKNHYLKYDGRPIFPGDLTTHVRGLLKS